VRCVEKLVIVCGRAMIHLLDNPTINVITLQLLQQQQQQQQQQQSIQASDQPTSKCGPGQSINSEHFPR
jgi:hypothetical protein